MSKERDLEHVLFSIGMSLSFNFKSLKKRFELSLFCLN